MTLSILLTTSTTGVLRGNRLEDGAIVLADGRVARDALGRVPHLGLRHEDGDVALGRGGTRDLVHALAELVPRAWSPGVSRKTYWTPSRVRMPAMRSRVVWA